ncbi:hypothetical protein BN1723_017088, partial [Verticillium longisporum]
PQVDIIFIHGITGHPYKTFATNGASPIYWPTQLLARDVPEARILSFGYDADVAKFLGPVGQNDIREHAATLISDIATVRIEDHVSRRPIILVVHSLGGLVAKKALCLSEQAAEQHQKQLHECVTAVAFLGTPHRGSDLAPFAAGVARILKASNSRVNVDIIRLLQRDSEALADIEAAFGIWLRKNTARFQLTCFFEEREVVGVGMVVNKDSAKISGYPQLPVPTNHMDLVRFASTEDTGYRRVDIIFIYGITGHPYKTFATNGATPIYWPTQLLARDVPEARILSFGYDADVAKFLGPVGQNDIREHAATLISDIATVRIEDHAARRPIILVVHSLGGLVAKKA